MLGGRSGLRDWWRHWGGEGWDDSCGQVFPCGVCSFDEGYLLCTGPAFQLLLSRDCSRWALKAFKPDEAVTVVLRGETFVELVFVLVNAEDEIARDPDVERAASAGDDVSEVAALSHGESLIGRRRDEM